MKLTVREAQKRLSHLLDLVAIGQEDVIIRHEKPIAKLVGIRESAPPERKFGAARGEFTVPDDFNDPLLKEIEDLFYK